MIASMRVSGARGALFRVAGGLVCSLTMLAGAAASDSEKAWTRDGPVQFGIFDPTGEYPDAPGLEVEHIYLSWDDIDTAALRRQAEDAKSQNRELLVTVEPWTWNSDTKQPSEELLAGILAGDYDDTIHEFCGTVGGLDVPVTVRWAHEMEDPKTPYTWSKWTPSDYIKAYRTFVDECRKHAPDVSFMWSPKGDPEAPSYYPGSRYVDSIGVSVFGFQTYDQTVLERERTVEELINERYSRFTDLGKPIYAAEFGCAGDAPYMRRCMQQMADFGDALPQLKGIIYFNKAEHTPWPDPFGLPDWRLPDEGATFIN